MLIRRRLSPINTNCHVGWISTFRIIPNGIFLLINNFFHCNIWWTLALRNKSSSWFRYICLPIYNNMVRKTRQPLLDEYLYPYFLKGCLGTLCLGLRRKSLLRSLRNLRCLLISKGSIFNTVLSIAWLNFPMHPIYLSGCDQLFHFLNCHACLDDFICFFFIDMKK